MKTPALRTFIKETCCNWVGDRCVGGEDRDGTCLVMQGRACTWFFKAPYPQAPQGVQDESFRLEPDLEHGRSVQGPFDSAARAYPVAPGALSEFWRTHRVRNVRRCDCGEPLGYRQRVCPECALKRRRKTARESKRRKRGSGVHT